MNLNQSLSHREAFVETRTKFGITVTALHRETQISKNHISEYSKGKRDASSSVLDKLINGMEAIQPGAKDYYCKLLLGKDFVDYEQIVEQADPSEVALILNAVSKRVGKGDLVGSPHLLVS